VNALLDAGSTLARRWSPADVAGGHERHLGLPTIAVERGRGATGLGRGTRRPRRRVRQAGELSTGLTRWRAMAGARQMAEAVRMIYACGWVRAVRTALNWAGEAAERGLQHAESSMLPPSPRPPFISYSQCLHISY
jgi:hypothetical protein